MAQELKGALIIGQSGGPTSVINASAYGVIKTALEAECITKVYGAHYGIKGVLNDDLFVMDEEDADELDKHHPHGRNPGSDQGGLKGGEETDVHGV